MNECAFIFDDVRIAPEFQIGMHSHRRWELSLVVCGSGTRVIGGRSEAFRAGELILVPPEMPHVWKFDCDDTDSEGNIANLSVFFEPPLLDGLAHLMPEMADIINRIKRQRDAVCYSGNARDRIAGLMVRMKGLAQRERVPLMIELLMAIADTEGCKTVGNPVPVGKRELRADRVRIYCSCNYSRRISLDEIAAHVAMNKSAFCTFMRRHMGMSLSEYVNSIRLEKALELLKDTERAVAEVAYDVGFSNIPYFNRLFRAKFGASPTELRRGATCVKA